MGPEWTPTQDSRRESADSITRRLEVPDPRVPATPTPEILVLAKANRPNQRAGSTDPTSDRLPPYPTVDGQRRRRRSLRLRLRLAVPLGDRPGNSPRNSRGHATPRATPDGRPASPPPQPSRNRSPPAIAPRDSEAELCVVPAICLQVKRRALNWQDFRHRCSEIP